VLEVEIAGGYKKIRPLTDDGSADNFSAHQHAPPQHQRYKGQRRS
jgi:hypothetical protein